MPNFILLLHQDLARPRPGSPDEFASMTKDYMAWADKIRAEGRLNGGEKLTDDPGKVIRTRAGRTAVTDGPYAESKELVGGYFIISAKDYAEACRLAEDNPHLKYGGRIEVREIEKM
ncbi:MAG TPA: YciI family protein [Stellaceae bacterium]|nr:YciI family protein [Stellaceae bacterium]